MKIKFLVCADVNIESAVKIVDHLLRCSTRYDAILLLGPFVHKDFASKEESSAGVGDITSIIALFENIVCRVIYLPTFKDPTNAFVNELNLTPNSLNVYSRSLNLTQNLFITGFSEKSEDMVTDRLPNDVDRSAESDDELENVQLNSSTAISLIKEILRNVTTTDNKTKEEENKFDDTSIVLASSGIFLLNYKFSFTLNQLLFHMQHQLDDAGIFLCIISSIDSTDYIRLPKVFGKLSIAAIRSLKNGGFYTTIDIEQSSSSNKWETLEIITSSYFE